MKPVIYQLFVRHFGNLNTARRKNGDIERNGCGKFADITEKALVEIQKLGFNHVWFTGILEHASGTAYPNRPADDPKILKGKAGSPYAVKDYFDVSPDLALDPEHRVEEFKYLIQRCHKLGLKVMIDFIPNHVARSYDSDVRPYLSFGKDDETNEFFHPNNHFYYIQDQEKLTLPGGEDLSEKPPRVTGNNVTSASPGEYDWYETVKLNYGFNYTNGENSYDEGLAVPKTWNTMDSIIAYWQALGVDGFRCDMAHMVPMDFWIWAVNKAKDRFAHTYFMAEAYDGDPMKVTKGNVLNELLESGFDAVYDSESYDLVKGIYEEGKWANDLDDLLWDETRLHKMIRYAENHDEVRIASPKQWGGHGAKVGMAASGFLFAVGRGSCMMYNGQEVGEPAIGEEGYSGDDGRTSIFDYTSLPELQKWVNGHLYDGNLLSEEQDELREWYRNWLHVIQEPAFTNGGVYSLNTANRDNDKYGRLPGEDVSGHWLFSFLRYDLVTDQAYLIVINFSPTETLYDIDIQFPEEARQWLGGYPYESIQLEKMVPCEVLTYCMKRRNDLEGD
mgnify:CR=1 FL=1